MSTKARYSSLGEEIETFGLYKYPRHCIAGQQVFFVSAFSLLVSVALGQQPFIPELVLQSAFCGFHTFGCSPQQRLRPLA
jgi:hypothetical protein